MTIKNIKNKRKVEFLIVTMIFMVFCHSSVAFAADSAKKETGEIKKIKDKYSAIYEKYQKAIRKLEGCFGDVKVIYSFEIPKESSGFKMLKPPEDADQNNCKYDVIVELDKLANDSQSGFKAFSALFRETREDNDFDKDEKELLTKLSEALVNATLKGLTQDIKKTFAAEKKRFSFTPVPTPRIILLADTKPKTKERGLDSKKETPSNFPKYENIFEKAREQFIDANYNSISSFRYLNTTLGGGVKGGNQETVTFKSNIELGLYPFASQSFEWTSSFNNSYVRKNGDDDNPVDSREFNSNFVWFPSLSFEHASLTELLEYSRWFFGANFKYRDDKEKDIEIRNSSIGAGFATKFRPHMLIAATAMVTRSWNKRLMMAEEEGEEDTFVELQSWGYTGIGQLKMAEEPYSLSIQAEYYKPDFDDDNFYVFVTSNFSVSVAKPTEYLNIKFTSTFTWNYEDIPVDPMRQDQDYSIDFGLTFNIGS